MRTNASARNARERSPGRAVPAAPGPRFRCAAVGLLTLVLLTGGCASADRTHRLLHTTESYNAAIRWGDFRGAVVFVHPDARPDERRLTFLLGRFDQIRVSGYAPNGRPAPAEEDRLIQAMELRLVNRHTLRERVVEDRQEWRYFPDEDRWWLMSGLPDIGREGH